MRFITVTELRADAPRIIREIESSGEEVIVTKNGKPVVLIRPVSEGEFELKGDGNGKS
jgi:prevent-host-death family protein